MIRNAQVGERVIVLDRYKEKPAQSGIETWYRGGKDRTVLGLWDLTRGNRGTITRIVLDNTRRKASYRKKIYVKPDHPNFGDCFWFRPGELMREPDGG